MKNHLAPGFGPLELEQLDEIEQIDVRDHLTECPRCASEYRLSSDALANVALSLPRTEPTPELRNRLLKSVAATSRFDSYAESVAEIIDVGVDTARGLLARIDNAASWMATQVQGVFSYDLPVGPAVANAVVGFVRITPGHFFPDHEHLGDETMLVLQGSCAESGGSVLRRGDLVRMSQGSHHDFKALPGPDFIYLGVAQGGFLMFGQHIKPGDPRG